MSALKFLPHEIIIIISLLHFACIIHAWFSNLLIIGSNNNLYTSYSSLHAFAEYLWCKVFQKLSILIILHGHKFREEKTRNIYNSRYSTVVVYHTPLIFLVC